MTTTTPVRDSTAQATAGSPQATTRRLPCRGCTRECGNYSRCNGKPWRMSAANTATRAGPGAHGE